MHTSFRRAGITIGRRKLRTLHGDRRAFHRQLAPASRTGERLSSGAFGLSLILDRHLSRSHPLERYAWTAHASIRIEREGVYVIGDVITDDRAGDLSR